MNQVSPVVTTQPGVTVPGQAAIYDTGGQTGLQAPPAVWMPKPSAGSLGCPPGLEYLAQVDKLVIKEQPNIIEMVAHAEQENVYNIFNASGQQVYRANEESDTCHRQCCRANRGFIMHVTDNLNNEVIRMDRVFRCVSYPCFSCIGCCAHRVNVEAPVGTVIGYVKRKPSFCTPLFAIMDADDNEVLVISGPGCICQGCHCDVDFNISSGESDVGKIVKLAPQDLQEMFSTADTFSLNFPMNLDVKQKALLFGATFLIDFLYFELSPGRRGRGRGRYSKRR
ncbi:phospholipid scramblase 1-like [Ruditapes philippinarum]|uniref:phospholipid scramblase 1-like n=1 Tax=Ruditapes philippinarum TaxID=129788 RepID=UPI00295C2488|nr:phospholipid scramblase 1-like [Ruditapes philippinarum]